MTNFSSLQDFLLQEEKERNYFNLMSEEGSKHLIFQCVISVLHVIFVIPTNIFTLIVIARTKSLWTLSNTILAINGLFMAVGSILMLFLRQSHFPLLLFDEQDRVTAFTIFWKWGSSTRNLYTRMDLSLPFPLSSTCEDTRL